MAAPPNSLAPSVLDELFARVHRATMPAPPLRPREASPLEEEWTQEEKQTVADFTRRQMELLRQQQAVLEQQRADVLSRQHELNKVCLLRQQELNRQIKDLTARRSTLEERETDLGQQEKQVAVEMQRLARARQDIQQFRGETAEQEQFLADLKNETVRLLDTERTSRQQLVELEASLRKRWAQLETARSEVARDRADLDRIADEQRLRQEVLDRREQALNLAEAEQRVARLQEQAEEEQRRVQELLAREKALQQRIGELDLALHQRQKESDEQEPHLLAQQERIEKAEQEFKQRLGELQGRERRLEEMLSGLMQAVSTQPCQRPTPRPSATRLM